MSEWKEKSSCEAFFFFPVSPGVFVEAFSDVARQSSVLSLDVRQDLHWVRFSLVHHSPCLSCAFHLKPTSVWKSCLYCEPSMSLLAFSGLQDICDSVGTVGWSCLLVPGSVESLSVFFFVLTTVPSICLHGT